MIPGNRNYIIDNINAEEAMKESTLILLGRNSVSHAHQDSTAEYL